MLEVAAHMELLVRQAQLKGERPGDGSFMPLSLALACLLRQLPSGLAPPAGMLSFHQIDRLPLDVLEQKLFRLLYGGSEEETARRIGSGVLERAVAFMRAVLLYVKTTRAMLTLCHQHLSNQRATNETNDLLVRCVVDALATPEEHEEEEEFDEQQQLEGQLQEPFVAIGQTERSQDEEDEDEQAEPHQTNGVPDGRSSQRRMSERRRQLHRGDRIADAQTVAVDPSGIMKRALARDVGDGSSVLEILHKYPEDTRIQAHGVRALKGVIRRFPREPTLPLSMKDPQRDSDASDDEIEAGASSKSAAVSTEADEHEQKRKDVIRLVIGSMKRYPDLLALQRDALFSLLEYTSQGDDHVSTVTSLGGVACIMEAMARLPDDEEAQIAALSILGHPSIADASVLRVNPESRRLVLSAMRHFPLSERLQGLGCLSLANLSLRHDESMKEIVARGGIELVVAAMTRFSDVGLIQAAGSWLLSTISAKDEEMLTACLDAGALPACEKARVRFLSDPRVQQHTVTAIHNMEVGHATAPSSTGSSDSPECCVQ